MQVLSVLLYIVLGVSCFELLCDESIFNFPGEGQNADVLLARSEVKQKAARQTKRLFNCDTTSVAETSFS